MCRTSMEYFIQLVQGYPAIYDTNHEDYSRMKTKNDIWKKIAKESNIEDGAAAKEQWRKLRECHRDALRRQKRKSANPGYAPRMWSFQKEMEFLLAYMGNRSNQTYNTEDFISEVTAEESFHEEEQEDLQEYQDEQSTHEIDPFVVAIKEEPPIKTKKSDLTSLMKETLKEYSQRSRERQIDRKRILGEQLMNDPERNEALYQFFMSMYHTTKAMPKDVQIQIRKTVFETVTKAEEELLYVVDKPMKCYTSSID